MEDNKLYNFFNRLYQYFKVSICYWLYLLKGAVIYGVFPATCALFAVMDELQTNDLDEPKELFEQYYLKCKGYKVESFIYSIVIILLYTSLFYVNTINNSVVLILKVIIIYIWGMLIILLPYTINYMVKDNSGLKESFIMAFVAMIKRFFTSMWVLIFSVMLIFLGVKNLVILIFIVPFMYVLGIRLLLNT